MPESATSPASSCRRADSVAPDRSPGDPKACGSRGWRWSDDLVFQIGLAPNRIAILTDIGSVRLDQAWNGRIEVEVAGDTVPVIGKDDLIRAKREVGRPQDLADVAALESME